jgi:predicted DNA-binding protein (UPF0251 family)
MKGMETVFLSLDHFEAMRLCDVDDLDQQQAGDRMGISRGTVQRMLYNARKQIVEAILNNQAIIINLKESEDCHVGMYSYKRQRRSGRHSQ